MVNAFIQSIYNALKANGTLMTKLAGNAGNGYKCYNVIAPQTATFPYIIFGLLTNVPMGTFTRHDEMENAAISLNIFSNSGSAKEAGEILDLVKAVLDDASLTITGYTNDMKCEREYIGPTLFDSDNKVFQIPMRYRVWAEKN